MSSSHSNPQNTTSSVTTASEQNTSVSGNTGQTVLGGSGRTDVTNISTDAGAVQAGTDVAKLAIAGNNAVTSSVLDFANSTETQSAHLVSDALDRGAQLISDTNAGNQSFLASIISAQNANLGNVAATLNQVTQSTAQTVQDIAQANATPQSTQQTDFAKVALYVIGAVLALGILAYAGRK